MWDDFLSELPEDEETDEEVAFIADIFDPNMLMLDLCCGQGRHSIRLAGMGYHIMGMDSSRSLLDIANRSSRLRFIQGDMRNIPVRENTFDAVINIFTSFGFFDDEGNMQVLKSVASVLKTGGRFLLDYWNPFAAAQLDKTRNWWWMTNSLLSLAEVQYDFSSGIISDLRTIVNIKTGITEKFTRELRFYTLPEQKKMLKESGLRIIEVYGDVDGREYDVGARRLITLSEK